MTPLALSDPSILGQVQLTERSANDLAALDADTADVIREAVGQTVVDFLKYATAYGQGTIAELLVDNPNLAEFGKILLDGKSVGLVAVDGNLRLLFTFNRRGIVLRDFWFKCDC